MNHMYSNDMSPQMMGYNQMGNAQPQPVQVVVVEPYVLEAAGTLIGCFVVVETTRGSISGTLIDAKPDHLVIQQRDSAFFVRVCEIVWIMPDQK